ncbi:ATP-binding protein [Streptomyces lunalinharesii]|uniref:ATP-binding protein n=1 Tax=Streptomyces lunalinharesii TaxID=333384 RepID=UPI003CD0BD15
MGLGVPRFTAYRFTACPATLRKIRRHTRSTLQVWGLAACAEEVVAVVNELVTNALRHGMPQRPSSDVGWLGIMHAANTVTCAVKDSSTAVPTCSPAHPLDPCGRGLCVVEALSCSWGCSSVGREGKTVWARLPTERASAGLPRSRPQGGETADSFTGRSVS